MLAHLLPHEEQNYWEAIKVMASAVKTCPGIRLKPGDWACSGGPQVLHRGETQASENSDWLNSRPAAAALWLWSWSVKWLECTFNHRSQKGLLGVREINFAKLRKRWMTERMSSKRLLFLLQRCRNSQCRTEALGSERSRAFYRLFEKYDKPSAVCSCGGVDSQHWASIASEGISVDKSRVCVV